jgi:hypothetical protein
LYRYSLGHDFRPDYKKLGDLKKHFPDVPLTALTATVGTAAQLLHAVDPHRLKALWFGDPTLEPIK